MEKRLPKATAAVSVTQTADPSADGVTRAPERGAGELSDRAPAFAAPAGDAQHRSRQRYEIIGEHGHGGIGRVSRAYDRDLRRDVAIKELIAHSQVSENRFLREAMITARLEHPGIVPVHEAGRWPDGTPFYAMKLVAGSSLRELIAERKTLAERIALLHHVIAVCDAIAYAHGRNIIHRDLKPANIIVGDFGETIVIDWGLAKDLTVSDDSNAEDAIRPATGDDKLTATGFVLGTPAYMAPEQGRGEHVDQRADVFAIGAMLWELCAFQRVPPEDLDQRHRMLRRAGIDRDLIVIIDKCLEADPARRYPHAGELATDLKAYKTGARIASRSYSLWGMLAHWVRQRRLLAASLIGAVVVIIVAALSYVHNIAVERDRADLARTEAERERGTAAAERDRAQLSEAAMWLEKDPTHAMDLLRASKSRDPQRSLLLTEGEPRAASRVLHVGTRVEAMRAAGSPLDIAIVTAYGDLLQLDLDRGELRVVDHDLAGPLTHRDGRWCYARQPTTTTTTTVTGCGVVTRPERLLQRPTSQLTWVNHALYALESGDLYRLDPSSPVRVGHQVRGFAGTDSLVMVCKETGQLQITRDGKQLPMSTCASNQSDWPMAARDNYYVALQTPSSLISERGVIPLVAAVRGNYAVSLGDGGLIGLADFSGGAWFVRPGSLQAEPVAQRASSPTVSAAASSLVAFGYADGGVVVVDALLGQRWEFIGHRAAVLQLVIDAPRRRVVSGSGEELRVWDLRAPVIAPDVVLPCKPFHIVPTDDPNAFAADCSDGQVFLWTPSTHDAKRLHAHRDLAYGLVMWEGKVCSAGWDGRVLCTPTHGGDTVEALVVPERIKTLASCGDTHLFAATVEGAVWQIDGGARLLYKHDAMPSHLEPDPGCARLASVAYDGSLIVYDLGRGRVEAQVLHAHKDRITSLAFQGRNLVTSGADANVRRWQLGAAIVLADDMRLTGAVNKLHLLAGGWVASVDGRTLAMRRADGGHGIELSLSHPIADIDVSSDERYIAAAGTDEVVVIDRDKRAVFAVYSPGGNLACIRFVAPDVLAICDTTAILSLRLDRAAFVPVL